MRVTLLRHAPTDGNLESQYIGCTDQPLSAAGVKLARSLKANRAVRTVHTSPLRRTVETAEILYPNAVIERHAELAEMNFGNFEGKSWRDLEGDAEYAQWVASCCESRCPNGEDKDEFVSRCLRGFERIFTDAMDRYEPEVNFVVHGGVIMSIMSEFALPIREYFNWISGYCGGYELETPREEEKRPLRLVRPLDSPYVKGSR